MTRLVFPFPMALGVTGYGCTLKAWSQGLRAERTGQWPWEPSCGDLAANEELRGESLTEIRNEVGKINFVDAHVSGFVEREREKKLVEYMFYNPIILILIIFYTLIIGFRIRGLRISEKHHNATISFFPFPFFILFGSLESPSLDADSP